jgi:hypothetical protein
MRSQTIEGGRILASRAGSKRAGARAAGVLFAALSSILLTIGLSFATSEAASATTTWGPPTQIAAPTASLSGSLAGVSCVDPTDCTAVGADNNGQPFYVAESAGVWGSVTQLAWPSGTGSFSAISCSSNGNCSAVGAGENDPAFTTEPIYATETDGTWGPVTEIPGGTSITGLGEFTDLSGVSCAGALDCTAVGDTGDMGGNVPVYTTETDGTWSAIQTFSGSMSEGNLNAVSCSDAADCAAAGNLSIGNTVPGWVTETAGSWGTPTEIAGTPSGFGSFSGLSCSSATSCTAVGRDNDQQPVQATENGGVWGVATEVSGSPGGSGSFSSVSCTAATTCTVVGSDGSGEPIYEVDSNGVWGTPAEVTGASGGSGSFAGVSCTQANDCTAVGVDGSGEPIYATESGGTWGTVTEISGTQATTASFASVSCVGVGSCAAVGGDSDGHPIYATETSGVWGTPVEVPGGPGSFTGVSCTGSGNCTAVGRENSLPVSATETNGVWGSPTVVNQSMPGSGVAATFSAVSCVTVADCTAVGGDSNGQPIYATETAGVWGTATELVTSASGSFTAVSCIDPTDCSAIGNSPGEALDATETAGDWSSPTTIASDSGTTVVTGLSCAGAGTCTAVGYDGGPGGQGPGIYLDQTNGAWDAPTTLSVPGSPGFGAFYGVSCTDANDCTAVGQANAPDSGTGAPVYATETVGAWGTPTALSGTPGGTGDLTGVSCVDASDCTAVGFDGNDEPIDAGSSAAVAPTVSSVSPTSGPTTGGTSITITGTGFIPGTSVAISQGNGGGAGSGAIAATGVQVVSTTEIMAVTGGGAEAGTWNVSVTTPGDTSANSAGDDFTYVAVPTVAKVSPNPGPVRWRGCRHGGLASFPAGPLVFGEGGPGARYFGLGYPSSTRGATLLTYELSWR